MTEPQSPDTTPPPVEPGAHDALEHLLGSLHRHGFLHLQCVRSYATTGRTRCSASPRMPRQSHACLLN